MLESKTHIFPGGPTLWAVVLIVFLASSQVMGQDRGVLGNTRSKPARPLAPQLKVGETSPKSKAHKKRYRTRGTQPPRVSKKTRDNRSLFSPRERGARTNQYSGAGYSGPAPKKGVRDNRTFIPKSPQSETDNKRFGKYASSGPQPRKGSKDTRKYFSNTPKSKTDRKNFGKFASSGPTPRKGTKDTRTGAPVSPETKVDTKNFGRFASSGPSPKRRVKDNRKYFPTSAKTKADRRNFGQFASSGPVPRKGVRDSRKYFSTTPTIKFGGGLYGQFATPGPSARKPIKDQRTKKIAGRYRRTPVGDEARFNKVRYVANVHGFDSPGALWRGNLRGNQKPKVVDRDKRRFLDGAYFNTALPRKETGRIAGLSANYQGNLIRRPVTGKYAKQMANYTGHQGDMRRYRIRMTRELATYAGGERTFKRSTGLNISGLLTFKRANKIYPRKDIAKYSGNTRHPSVNYKKTTGAYSQGEILVRNRYKKTWFQANRESVSYYFSNFKFGIKTSPTKRMSRSGGRASAYYSGRYKLSRPVKGAHPTAIYARNINRHKSAEKKETNRKRNLWINRLFVFKGKDQPDDFKKPVRKPKYDRKEHQIWNE